MYFEWKLDEEDGLDAYDPLGSFYIIGDEGKIVEECTYIDAFFEALANNIDLIKSEEKVIIDPMVEPQDIIFISTSETLRISYGTQSAFISRKEAFLKDFYSSLKNFSDLIDELTRTAGVPSRELKVIRKYLESKQNS